MPNQLTPGKTAAIRGKVTWSRIRARIEGEALKRENERRKARNQQTTDKPFTQITVCDAQIVPLDPSGQTLTPEEIYAVERMFDGKAGRCYTGESKGKYLPDVGIYNQQTRDVTWLTSMEGELASGMDVTVIMSAFEGKPNNGFGLQAVICNEPIRYFGKQPLTPRLNAYAMYNITSAPTPRNDVASAADDIATPDEMDPALAGMMPPPGGRPVSAPQGNAFDAGQQSAGYYPQQAQPAPAGYYPPQTQPQPPVAPTQPVYPQQPAQPAPAGYYPQQPPAAPAADPAQPIPAGYPGAGPFTPHPAAPQQPAGPAYPPYGGASEGVTYNPAEDPNRQY